MASLAVQLRALRDGLTDRATRNSFHVEQTAADQAAAVLRAVTATSDRISIPAEDDPRAMARAARRLRSQGSIGSTITIARRRAHDLIGTETEAAAVAGYRQDQSQRQALYQAATVGFIQVDASTPAAAELAPIRMLTLNGRTPANWADIESTALWSSLLGAFSNRVASESGGWEAGLRLISRRIGTAYDRYSARARDLAFHFYMIGVLASGRESSDAFAAPTFDGEA